MFFIAIRFGSGCVFCMQNRIRWHRYGVAKKDDICSKSLPPGGVGGPGIASTDVRGKSAVIKKTNDSSVLQNKGCF